MPRRKTIYVNEMELLAAIGRVTKGDIESLKIDAKLLEREYKKHRAYGDWDEACRLRRAIERIKGDGVIYGLPGFAGRALTPSERIRHQEAIRRLSDQGYVQLYGDRATRVKVLPKGWKALEAKPDAAISLTNK